MSSVEILTFPPMARCFYGTQRRVWPGMQKSRNCPRSRTARKRSRKFRAEPIVLAEDSESADVTADLVDVGGGDQEAECWTLLSGAILGPHSRWRAAGRRRTIRAAGIVSYAQTRNGVVGREKESDWPCGQVIRSLHRPRRFLVLRVAHMPAAPNCPTPDLLRAIACEDTRIILP